MADDELKCLGFVLGCFSPPLQVHGVTHVASAALSLLPPSSTTQAGDNNNDNITLEEWQLDPERGLDALGTPQRTPTPNARKQNRR